MVNIGGRSKGCSTCRRRRVKCDENRPICRRCERAGLECTGAKDITFIEGKILKSRRGDRGNTALTKPDAGNPTSVPPQLPPSSSVRGNEIEIYACHTREYLLHGGLIDRSLEETQHSDIVSAGTTTPNASLFPQAVLSFGTILFGTRHGQTKIIDYGYTIHGAALKQLNQAISDSKRCTQDDVLLSVVALSLLECYVPTGPRYYLKHMLGLERLLDFRGPSSFYSPYSSTVFKDCRFMILFASLSTGRSSILEKAEWKALSREFCSDEEMEEQDLIDTLADCTVLAAERNGMLAKGELDTGSGIHNRDEIRERALVLLHHLREWRKRWEGDERNHYSKTSIPSSLLQSMEESSDDGALPSFVTIYQFSNDSAAVMMMFYCTVLIYVLRILASLPYDDSDICFNKSFSHDPLQHTEHLDEPWKQTTDDYIAAEQLAALDICRIIPYYFVRNPTVTSGCPPIAHLAIATTLPTLRGMKLDEARWMIELIDMKSQKLIAKVLWASGKD